jgi:hypothetical protein
LGGVVVSVPCVFPPNRSSASISVPPEFELLGDDMPEALKLKFYVQVQGRLRPIHLHVSANRMRQIEKRIARYAEAEHQHRLRAFLQDALDMGLAYLLPVPEWADDADTDDDGFGSFFDDDIPF